jgi:Protein of unknown function (DUF2844)
MRTVLAGVAFVLLGTTSSWAVLGKPIASVAGDQQRMNGELRASTAAGFSVQEIAAADGVVVREYSSPAGDVFAVSWRGATRPNLVLLLGDYYPEFQQASRSTVRHRGSLSVRTPHLVVEMGGPMRALHGRAYLPERLPATVTAADLR